MIHCRTDSILGEKDNRTLKERSNDVSCLCLSGTYRATGLLLSECIQRESGLGGGLIIGICPTHGLDGVVRVKP